MNLRELMPSSRSNLPGRYRGEDPFFALQREMNRLFNDAFSGFDLPLSRDGAGWPSIEVVENDKETRIEVDLPGMTEKDIDIVFSEGMLIIRGEKKSETKDEERRFSERRYGSFERRISVDPEVDSEQIKANFANGVLTLTMPKSEKARKSLKHIPIGTANQRKAA